jgi:hypothetical protein
VTVEYADEDPEGLTQLLGELIEQNLARDPTRRRLLRTGTAVISSTDAGAATTLRFGDGIVRVEDGHRAAQVVVAAESRLLFALIAAPLRLGFPDLFSKEGRAVTREIVRRHVRIQGLVRHVGLVRRLTMLLSAR